jgi:hypothetical protein
VTAFKSRFTFFGQTGLTLLIGISALAGITRTVIGFNDIPYEDKLFFIFGGPFILIVTFFVWRKILVEINQIEITDNRIIIKNILTRKCNEINRENIKGFKDHYRNGHTILLIDHSNKVVCKIHEHYYKNFSGLINRLELNYIGRIPTFLDKIFKKIK